MPAGRRSQETPMVYAKTIVCLANSTKKHPMRCVAGKEVSGKQHSWIRPVTDDPHSEGAIPLEMTKCDDGNYLSLLDIVEIPLAAPRPNRCQTENHLVSPGVWKKIGRTKWDDLPELLDCRQDLWGSGHSSRYGVNDAVPTELATGFDDSLRLLLPTDLRVVVEEEQVYGENRTKLAMRACFTHGGIPYRLKVTDPYVTDKMKKIEKDVEHPLKNTFISVSVSDAFAGNHYKLIAGILTPTRASNM